MDQQINQVIKEELGRQKLPQSELARRIGTPQPSLNRALAGHRGIGSGLLERIMAALKLVIVPLSWVSPRHRKNL